MATTIGMQDSAAFDIVGMVSKPAWKQVLLELIGSGRVDPWNVDIVAIADAYIKKIKEMKSVDLLVPANVVLAASILLRYKSDYLRIQETPQEVYIPTNGAADYADTIPELSFVARIPPKRQITMHELMDEMEKIIRYESGFKIIKHKGGIGDTINITISEEDIEKRMGSVYEHLKNTRDSEGLVLFSRMIEGRKSHEIIYILLSLLHLTQKKQVDLRQDDIFGEIFVSVLDGEGKENRKDAKTG